MVITWKSPSILREMREMRDREMRDRRCGTDEITP
jgi:hypothetical protein